MLLKIHWSSAVLLNSPTTTPHLVTTGHGNRGHQPQTEPGSFRHSSCPDPTTSVQLGRKRHVSGELECAPRQTAGRLAYFFLGKGSQHSDSGSRESHVVTEEPFWGRCRLLRGTAHELASKSSMLNRPSNRFKFYQFVCLFSHFCSFKT